MTELGHTKSVHESRPTRAEFRVRAHCITCQSTSFRSIWTGKFSDDAVRFFMRQHFYSGDVDRFIQDEEFNLVICNHCNQMFHQRILTPDWMNILYSEWIDDAQIEAFENHVGKNPDRRNSLEVGRQWLKHGLRLTHLLDEAFPRATHFNVLDFGCGDGQFISSISMLGMRAFGIDFSATRDDRAGQRGVNILSSLNAFRELNIDELHAITLFMTLEHVDEPLEMLKELSHCLTPRGVLIVEVPDCSGIHGAPENHTAFHNVQPLEHVNNFTPDTLSLICREAGFTGIRKPPAHVTTKLRDLLKTEASRWIHPKRTSQYFRKTS